MEELRHWFLRHRRDLPWRGETTPYAVWVSEVMLQQTRASVVVPYFERWMKEFPTIQALAEAPLEAVIKAWEGLGYYSRARNLHEGAKYVMGHFGGVLPAGEALLRQIKGLGPYTIGAIRSFAFNERAAAVDGNVLRVMARYHDLHEDIGKSTTIARIRQMTYDFLPERDPGVVMEALIELGATLCGKSPVCMACPLRSTCKGFASRTSAELPVKMKKVPTELLQRAVALLRYESDVLVRKCPKGEIMSDLHEFPYVEDQGADIVMMEFEKRFGRFTLLGTFPQVKHNFTRFRATLTPYVLACSRKEEISGYFWHPVCDLHQLAFSSGHRRVVDLLREQAW